MKRKTSSSGGPLVGHRSIHGRTAVRSTRPRSEPARLGPTCNKSTSIYGQIYRHRCAILSLALFLAPQVAPKSTSELSFDNLGLESIPAAQQCAATVDVEREQQSSQVNVVSYANNRIRRLGANAFVCFGASLRILVLSYNELEQIHDEAFSQLEILQVLLLDNNLLSTLPSIRALEPTKSLRHLSLADNRIETLDSDAFGPASANLISLNLKGNPLHRMAPNSLSALAKLKTLTLSQSNLSGDKGCDSGDPTNRCLKPLEGLHELRFYHLDRATNLRSIPENLCQSSRKLSSLVMKSNQLERIPQFAHCQSLLLLDLSYNKLLGQLSANFTRQPNLIDLYLGHNQLDSIEANAFAGLSKLQVLELDNNKLKHIHSLAFAPLGLTIRELSISNNQQLSALPQLGLENLASLRAFGNQQLRELPHLKSAVSLALTYAYHCCDYLQSQGAGEKVFEKASHQADAFVAGQPSLFAQLVASITTNFVRLIGIKLDKLEADNDRGEQTVDWFARTNQFYLSNGNEQGVTHNLSEKILWPSVSSGQVSDSFTQVLAEPQLDLFGSEPSVESGLSERHNKRRRKKRAQQHSIDSRKFEHSTESANELTLGHDLTSQQSLIIHSYKAPKGRRQRQNVLANREPNERLLAGSASDRLIDELVRQVKQIRSDHSVAFNVGSSNGDHILLTPSSKFSSISQPLQTDESDNTIKHKMARTIFQKDWLADESESTNSDWLFEIQPILTERVARSLAADFNLASRYRRHKSETPTGNSPLVQDKRHTVQCVPEPNAFLPCRDLFDTWWLRAGIWSVFVLAFTGNILVIIVLSSVRQSSSTSALTSIMWLAHSKRHIDVPRFLVINLAIADLMMAIYLGLLAFVDLSTLGEFKLFAIKWQYSNACKLAGFLGVLSSELSVFILAIITIERNYAITNAVHLNRRLSLQNAMLIMFIGYTFAFVMALMPLNGISDYRKFSICLPLDTGSNLSSQLYVITLISINTFSFLLLLSCYLRIYCAIRGSQAWNTNELRIAKRMSILVLTDFLCWMPIIIVALSSLFGYHMVDTNGIKILTIFILPLNSVANPFLYAITTKKFKHDLSTLIGRLRSLARRANVNTATTNNNNNTNKNLKFCAGYNQNQQRYQDNLMAMKNKKRKLNQLQQQKQQQHLLHLHQNQHHNCTKACFELEQATNDGLVAARKLLKQTNVCSQQRFDTEHNRNARWATANQVTMNRTTCSCQRINQEAMAVDEASKDSIECRGTLVSANTNQQPKIVLDSVALECNCDNCAGVADVGSCGATEQAFAVGAGGSAQRGSAQFNSNREHLLIECQPPSRSGYHVAVVTRAPCRQLCEITHELCKLDNGHQCVSSLRPQSADVGNQRLGNNQTVATRTSCQAIIVKPRSQVNSSQGCGHKDMCLLGDAKYLNVESTSQVANRSASACGYRTDGEFEIHQAGCKEPKMSGSCGAMRVGGVRSTDKLTRSINRLLFGPIANAWSSIQISLNSSVSQVACPNACQSPRFLHEPYNCSHGIPPTQVPVSLRRKKQRKSDEKVAQTSQTIEDILMMSGNSSTRVLNRISERRMSRSCDMIPQKKTNNSPRSSSSSENEPTTTTTTTASHDDCDDDQRILLSSTTNNRFAGA